MSIGLIDLEISNIQSVRRAFDRIKRRPEMVVSATDLDGMTAVILPGVGSFPDGMASLRTKGLIDPLRRFAETCPVVGICLGMQLLGESSSEHGTHEGLGIIPGQVEKLIPTPEVRVPHVGWSELQVENSHPLISDEVLRRSFYFVHSYHFTCSDPADVVASAEIATGKITAVIGRGLHLGVQFHPEKSQDAGLDLLDSLIRPLEAQPQRS